MIDLCVINYNTKDKLERFLSTLNSDNRPEHPQAWKLFVADNGSEDGSDSWLEEKSAQYNIDRIMFNSNIGYAAAANDLAARGESEFIGILNADVWMNTSHVRAIIRSFNDNPQIAILGPKQRDENGHITHAGIFGTNTAPKHRDWRTHDPHDLLHRSLEECVTVSGSAYFIRRNVWNALAYNTDYLVMLDDFRKSGLITDRPDNGNWRGDSLGAFLPTRHYYEETWCLPAGQSVWTKHGRKNIENMRPGDSVWSYVNGGLKESKVLYAGLTGYKKTLTITTQKDIITLTGDHPVLVEENGTASFKKAEDIHIGDRVVSVNSFPEDINTDDSRFSIEEMQFFGAFIGDGCLDDGAVHMSIPAEDRVRGYYEQLAVKLFDKRGVYYNSLDEEFQVREPVHIQNVRNGFRFNSLQAVNMFKEFGLTGTAKTKRIPATVFAASYKKKLAFLAGLVDSGGHITERGTLTFKLANKDLIEDIRLLMRMCGMPVGHTRQSFVEVSELPNPGLKERYELWSITYENSNLMEIPFVDELYRERVNNAYSKKRWSRNQGNYLSKDLASYIVTDISRSSVEVPVYDIQVEEGESFVGEGIVLHNCSYFARHLGYKVFYDGRISIGHSWHASSDVGGHADRLFGESKKIFVEACERFGIEHD